MYEFNEVLGQVNELGHVFGVFHFRPIASHDASNNKKVIIMTNIVSSKDPEDEKSKEKPLQSV